MRRITLAIVSTISGLLLLFSYHTSTMGAGTTTAGTASTGSTGGSTSTVPNSGSAGGATVGDGTYTGDSMDTRWGPVQVEITVAGGRITAATALVYPNGNPRDQQINAYALPVLAQEVVAAQNAQIDTVSGATVTSDGYIGSLQSAIDRASL